jgi:hypothetical protein
MIESGYESDSLGRVDPMKQDEAMVQGALTYEPTNDPRHSRFHNVMRRV